MRSSFVLGIVGGIFSFLAGIFAFFVMTAGQAFGFDVEIFPALIALAFIAGSLGIIGGAIGKRKGGVILIVGGVLALIATSLFGILPLILMLVGGILTLREEKTSKD